MESATFTARVRRMGNGLGIIIPPRIVRKLGLKEGQMVVLHLHKKRRAPRGRQRRAA